MRPLQGGKRLTKLRVKKKVLITLVLFIVGLCLFISVGNDSVSTITTTTTTTTTTSSSSSTTVAPTTIHGSESTKDPKKRSVGLHPDRVVAVPSLPFELDGANDAAAWVDGETAVLHARTEKGAVMLFPITWPHSRDRREASAKADGGSPWGRWASVLKIRDPAEVPGFATAKEHNTLLHASIFVSIAAYRDPECADTLESLLREAKSPHRLYFGISEEREAGERSCLEPLGLREILYETPNSTATPDDMMEAKRLLYGSNAPVDRLGLERRFLTWEALIGKKKHHHCNQSNLMLHITPVQQYYSFDAYKERTGVTLEPGPAFREHGSLIPETEVFLDEHYASEKIVCLAGEAETLRDWYRLEEDCNTADSDSPLKFRRGKGGAQEGPFPAVAGCRVTARLAGVRQARGPTYGRYVTSLFYFDQDYFMVVDSHSRFSLHFDMKMILRVFQAPTRAVLSHYPNGYTPAAPTEEYYKLDVMSMCMGQILANGMPKLGARWQKMGPRPTVEAFAAAGYMFGDAAFVIANPFDPFLPYLFDGEEILFSARMWTSGFDIYCPGQANILHHYGRSGAKRDWDRQQREASLLKARSENRALYLLQRYKPWAEKMERFNKIQNYLTAAKGDLYQKQNNTPEIMKGVLDTMQKALTAPPYEAPALRYLVPDDKAKNELHLFTYRGYYGMGKERTLEAYWDHTKLSDTYVKKRDNEGRWEGGLELCDAPQ